jgi:hypothetical protein
VSKETRPLSEAQIAALMHVAHHSDDFDIGCHGRRAQFNVLNALRRRVTVIHRRTARRRRLTESCGWFDEGKEQ